MDLWKSVNGAVTIEVTSADIAGMLCALHEHCIPLEHVQFKDELCCAFRVQRQHVKAVKIIIEKRGETWKIIGRTGIHWQLRSLLKRPVLICGITAIILLTVLIPTRIFFFKVEGNSAVPDRYILELAAQCGLEFGAFRQEIRSERVKNQLLSAIPELEWVGINTAGCVATISVRERQRSDDKTQLHGVTSIVAARDGVVREITVTGGSAACKTGQAVKAGQVLISGYTDCGISIRAERAQGEVYAQTYHEISCIMPHFTAQRGEQVAVIQKMGIIIGKNRINFSQDSGILDTGCVKMYEENYVTLPGGFILPIAIVTETYIYYEDRESVAVGDLEDTELPQIAQSYLSSQMIAGRIVNADVNISRQEDAFLLSGKYECLEMIGQERLEEIITP
ncbi:MAG: hypothetical protein E7455_00330 [Ruminococcaceae bacterium]|nr:hypothetical protein [Oscillospiraceae bacterium]